MALKPITVGLVRAAKVLKSRTPSSVRKTLASSLKRTRKNTGKNAAIREHTSMMMKSVRQGLV